MKSNKILIGIGILLSLIYLLIYHSFERMEVPDVQWEVDYFYENKNPHGGWLIQKILSDVYSEDRVKKLEIDNFIPGHDPDSRRGYFVIGSYLGFDKRKVDSLALFVEKSNDAIIIASDKGYYIDSLFQPYFSTYNFEDSIISLSLLNDTSGYQLSYYYYQLDSAANTYFDGFDSIKTNVDNLKVLSYAQDSIPVLIHLPFGAGNFYIHSIPDAFST